MLAFRHLIALALLLALTSPLRAQDTAYVREVLDALCSDLHAGRGYVDDGDNEAAFFIEKQFKDLGLRSWDYDFYQTFFVTVNTFPGEMALGFDGNSLTPGVDFIISADAPSVKGEWPLTYLDRLPAVAPSGRVLDSTLSFKGAVVLPDSLIAALPRHIKGELLKGLKKAGARMVIRSSGSKLTWHVSSQQVAIPEFIVRDTFLSARPERVRVNAEARLQKKHRTQNVLAYIEGSERTDSTIVFTAHYDHLGKMGKNTVFRGANDNASGVTMLLSLAKHYSLPENAPRHNIAFIAFAAEELGLLGSSYYVEQPIFPLADIVFLINLDIVGTGDEGIKVVNGAVLSRPFERLSELNEEGRLLPKVEKRGKAAISDHHPFTEKGVPCFYIYTLGGSKAYHDVNDRSEGLSLAGFSGLFKLLTSFISTF